MAAGEFEYYAGLSGLPAGTLADHKTAYLAAQTGLPGTVNDNEHSFYGTQEVSTEDFDARRLDYFMDISGLPAGTTRDHMNALFT